MFPVPGVWGVVVAAGSGQRYGKAKQFEELNGRRVVEWSVETCKQACEGVVVVLPPGSTNESFGADIAVAGGSSRSASVRNGLDCLPDHVSTVVVHDAARPVASIELYEEVIATLATASNSAVAGVICAIALNDTIKRVSGEPVCVSETLEREGLVVVQTPQAFRLDVLRYAHASGADATDDAGLVERIGGTIRVVDGDPRNVKITTPADLSYCEYLLAGAS